MEINMQTPLYTLRTIALAAAIAVATSLAGSAHAVSNERSIRLLTASFAARPVVQVEVGDFRFKPGQVAPIHTHQAPAVGYVAKGMIIYQVEGGQPQILRAGDAFFEPTGTRVLRFDNASATEEAVFVDFNLEQVNEPFIVFEQNPTEAIDRRTLPTVKLNGKNIDKVDVYANKLGPNGTIDLPGREPTLGFVAEGIVELRVKGQAVKRVIAGGTFAIPSVGSQAKITNVSAEVPANVITLRLH
jgi:quercetin dioxygenase-like cupin family protein